MDEFEKIEMAKSRAIPENTWHQCYDYLINDIPKCGKVSKQYQTKSFNVV